MARVLTLASHADSLVNFRGPLLETMLAHGHMVHVAAPGAAARIRDSAFAGRVEVDDVAMRRTGIDPFADLRLIAAYRKLISRVRPDVLLAYTIKPVIYGCIVARQEGVPAIHPLITGLGYVFENSSMRARAVRAVVTPLYRKALSGATTTFFQNSDNRARFERYGIIAPDAPTRIVAGSGVNLARFAPRPLPAAPAVLMIGRLLGDKGVREYARAAELVRAERPNVPFRLVGWFDEGNPAAITRGELAGWQAAGTIDYLGALDDVREALADSTIYTLPSYHEGMPRTVLEAMATGRAIVTTDVAGCRETVDDGMENIVDASPETIKRHITREDPPAPRLCFLVNDAAFFVSHRLPLALAAARAGYEVHVACPPSSTCRILRDHGLRHHPLAASRGRSSLWSFVALARDYVRLFRRVRPDLVHLVTAKPIIFGGIVARLLHIPSLSAISGLGFIFIHDTFRIRILKALALRGYGIAINHCRSHVIFQNEDDRDAFRQRGLLTHATHSLIRGSGVDLDCFQPSDEPPGPVVVLLPARMLRDKGVIEFVEAAHILRARGTEAIFRLQGQIDPDNPTAITEAELARWAAQGVVSWHPHSNAIEDVLKRVHIIAFPSYREGMPKTIIDAAAAGRPCVTTDVPGCRHAVVAGETALLVRVRDPIDLADKLQTLIEDRPRRIAMGRAARRLAERRFDIRQVTAEHLRLYAGLSPRIATPQAEDRR